MFKNKAIIFILLAAILVSGKAYCQQIKTVTGKVLKIDLESGVINVVAGVVAKQAFSDAHLDADPLWEELIKNNYIDSDGVVQAPFYELDKFPKMLLSKEYKSKKKLIYDILQKSIADSEMMVFNIDLDTELLQGTHRIASIEIEQGDPVTIQYDASSDKNNITRLVDNKPIDN